MGFGYDLSDLVYDIWSYVSSYVLLLVLLIMLGLFLLVMGYIFACNTLKCIGRKAKVKGDWMAYVPFAQDIYRLKIARMPMWQLCFFGGCGAVLITLVELLIGLIGRGSTAHVVISSIIYFAWLLLFYYVNFMFRRALYTIFGFNRLLALIVVVPGMQAATLILDILIAYKNDIQWKQTPAIKLGEETAGGQVSQPMQPERRAPGGSITAVSGAYAGAVFSMKDNETRNFGRDPMQCQIVFDDKNIEVSHMHCSIRYSAMNNSYIVTDYSKTGTWLDNNTRLRPNMANTLPAGTVIFLGSRKNTFRLG